MLKPRINTTSTSTTTRLSLLLASSKPRLQLFTTIPYRPHVRPPPEQPIPHTFSRNCSNSNSNSNPNPNPNPNNPLPPHQAAPTLTYNATMSTDEISQYLAQTHDQVFERNKTWATEQLARDPSFFEKLTAGQTPEYLWIGCSDSRIPAEQITGLQAGEAFIHRNIANLVVNADLNAMAVIEYAVRHLRVKHVVVCGHYGCGGVKAAMTPKDLGLLNPWLRNIRDVYRLHEAELDGIATEDARYDRLVELSVVEQCRNVIKTAAVQQSYEQDHFPIVHGWVFDFKDGLLKDLKIDHESMLHSIQKIYNLTKDN